MNYHEKIKTMILLFLIIILNVYITCKQLKKKEGFMNKVMKKIKKELQKFGDKIMKTILQEPVKLIPIKEVRNGLLKEMKGKKGVNMILALAFGIVKLIFLILVFIPLIIIMLKVMVVFMTMTLMSMMKKAVTTMVTIPKTDPTKLLPVVESMIRSSSAMATNAGTMENNISIPTINNGVVGNVSGQ